MTVPVSPVPMWMILSTLALSMVGLIGNLLIVMASFVSRQLRGRCQLFIAALAGVDVLVCVYLVLLRILMMLGWFNVTNAACFLMSAFGLFALNAQSAIGLILGIDRLLAVLIPLRYRKIPNYVYGLMWVSIVIYAFLLTVKGYTDMNDDNVVVCLPPTAYNNDARMIWIFASFLIAVLVLFVYGAANIKCRLMAKSATEASSNSVKRLLSSLTLVVVIYSSTWFLTILMLVLTQVMNMAPETVQLINQQLAWLVIINASLNFFIYYWRAPEYRKAFKYMLTGGQSSHPNFSVGSFATRRKSVWVTQVQPESHRGDLAVVEV